MKERSWGAFTYTLAREKERDCAARGILEVPTRIANEDSLLPSCTTWLHGLHHRAWPHYQAQPKRRTPVDITNLGHVYVGQQGRAFSLALLRQQNSPLQFARVRCRDHTPNAQATLPALPPCILAKSSTG